MEDEKLQISRKNSPKGEDGYRTFSVRVKEDVVLRLDRLSEDTGRSRNELISLLLEYGLNNSEVVD